MKLLLVQMPDTLRGIYGAHADKLGTRMLYAHPDLARAITSMERDGVRLTYSDMFRSAEESLARRRDFEKRKLPQLAQPPGKSAHNFGLAIDIAVDAVMHSLKMRTKADLDALLCKSYGLYCHRRDGRMGSEAWHYNALGPNAQQWLTHTEPTNTAGAVEAKILALYGGDFALTRDAVSDKLRYLGFLKDSPTTDNITAAVKGFQSAWDLPVDGVPGPATKRLLAFVCAETTLVTL